MITVPGKIARAGGKTVIVPEFAIDREITRQEIQTVEIRLFDGREISPEQRRKIFAIIGDIAWYSGHEPEYLRKLLTLEFVKDKESKEPNPEFVKQLIQSALQKGLLLENAGSAGNVIRFLAPLCMTDEQMEKGLEIFGPRHFGIDADYVPFEIKEK